MTDYYAQQGSGGGFVPGSQGSPSGSPGGTKRANASLRPVTCRQIIDASRSPDETGVIIDGAEATQLTVVAQVVQLNTQATNLVMILDDGTGQIEARQWLESGANSDASEVMQRQGVAEHEWVRVLGTIKHFANKRHFAAMVIRPVPDPHEVYFALLEALQIHLHFTRGPPAGANTITSGSSAAAYAPQGSAQAASDPFASLPPMERKIVTWIINTAPGDQGIHVTNLTKGLGPNVNAEEVSNALERLTESGHIYNTVDEFHYNVST